MLSIKIKNSEIEDFVHREFKDTKELELCFIEFLKHQRIKKDVEISLQEFENGNFVDIDTAFDNCLKDYE